MADSIADRVVRMIADQVDRPADEITAGQTLVGDLGMDSLDVVEMTMQLEDEFGLTVSDEDADKIKTVGQAIDYVAGRVNAAQSVSS